MLKIKVGEREYEAGKKNGQWLIDGKEHTADIKELSNGRLSIILNNRVFNVTVEKTDRYAKTVTLSLNGKRITTQIEEPIDQLLKSMGLNASASQKKDPLKAPMPGLVLKIMVAPGQEIHKGESLVILEAMKMENILKAPADCKIKNILVKERTAVEKNTLLIDFE